MSGKGNVSQTKLSIRLDQVVKNTARKIRDQNLTSFYCEEGHENNSSRYKLLEFIKLSLKRGLKPDGFLWFDKSWYSKDGYINHNRKCKFIFEAKHQGNQGNAIERWTDNFDTSQQVYPEAKYVTFLSGDGCVPNGTLAKFAEDKKKLHGDKVEFYLKQGGFSEDEVFEIMMKYLNKEV